MSTRGHGQREWPDGDKWSKTTQETLGGSGVSEANGVLRNHYHPPGATIYIEKRLTNQSYRLFSLYLYLLLNIGLLFSVSFKSALEEVYETVY